MLIRTDVSTLHLKSPKSRLARTVCFWYKYGSRVKMYRACVSESYVCVEIVIVAVLVLMFVNEYNLFVIFEEMQEQFVASGLCT